jgi:hypothetical protein
MAYERTGAVKVSTHWLRSPLTNVNKACQTCHGQDEKELIDRVELIQDRTAALKESTEKALTDAIDAIAAAEKAGAGEQSLKQARHCIAGPHALIFRIGKQHATAQETARIYECHRLRARRSLKRRGLLPPGNSGSYERFPSSLFFLHSMFYMQFVYRRKRNEADCSTVYYRST